MSEYSVDPSEATRVGDPFTAAANGRLGRGPDRGAYPCACYSGWIFITYEDEHGEERDVSYPCRRCEEKR